MTTKSFYIGCQFICFSYLTTAGKVILILGAGFGGLSAANILRKELSPEHHIVIIDKKDYFMMGLVNLWILNGNRKLEDSKISLNKLKNKGIEFLNDEIIEIDANKRIVVTRNNKKVEYDYLIIALGSDLTPERTNASEENGRRGIFNLYNAEEIPQLRQDVLSLKNGRITICITDIPYKCPPAPYEASLIIDGILLKNGTRQNVDIDIYTPTPIALPVAGPKISQDIVNLLNTHHINFHGLHKIKRVFDRQREVEFENGNSTQFDILALIPHHKIPRAIENSLGLIKKGENWIKVDKYTLKTDHENVFAVGDVTEIRVNQDVAIPKAGIFAEGEAKAVARQIIDEIANKRTNEQDRKFDGKGFCFVETGNKKAGYLVVDFFNKEGPVTDLEQPSEESYDRKIDFEKSRLNDWLA